jgi:hypothetical protein
VTVRTTQEPLQNPSIDTPEIRREVLIFDVDVTLPGVQALLGVVVAVEKELRRAASSGGGCTHSLEEAADTVRL